MNILSIIDKLNSYAVLLSFVSIFISLAALWVSRRGMRRIQNSVTGVVLRPARLLDKEWMSLNGIEKLLLIQWAKSEKRLATISEHDAYIFDISFPDIALQRLSTKRWIITTGDNKYSINRDRLPYLQAMSTEIDTNSNV